ncbi:mitochondrial carrier domain-containing protein [Absidia repens]|uniref:Mitochondrial carrier domain-containing protein n=1 Tax=Absidia repens TaxID=90262 RepID=A0A1X2I9S3_9FUNG|nr:mitochondrial carrier domain-containing protein [Absidia repens]
MPSYVTDANLNSYQLAFCGAVAGVMSRFVVAPLDVVKIRMQLQNHRTGFGFGSTPHAPIKYTGVLHSLKTIFKEEGIRGWYKGNVPAEYLYLSYSAIEFWTYKELETLIDGMDPEQKVPRVTKTFVSGMVAGSVATTLTYPFDLLRTRFAVQGDTKHYTGIYQAMKSIYTSEGMPGFYPGIRPALVQIMPYMGLLFATTHDMLSGALSGIFSKTAVYPIDVVRKRLQVQGPYLTNYVIQSTKYQSDSWWQCMKLSLYKGLIPSLIKVAPANAVTFLVFEETKKILVAL